MPGKLKPVIVMRSFYFTLTFLFLAVSAISQENKPTPGRIGVGFSINNGMGNRIAINRVLKHEFEIGFEIGFKEEKSREIVKDSVDIETTEGPNIAWREEKIITPSFNFTIVPVITKHASLASNLDAFIGLQFPLSFGSKTQSTHYTKVSMNNYSSEVNILNKQPATHEIGMNLIFGCQWFFYKNAALGAVCGFGATSYGMKGNCETITTTTNTGSLNPSKISGVSKEIFIRDNRVNTINSFNDILGSFLTYYF